ncbi:MAG: glucose 1-dehydrogenase [Solirubrobacterales bacterium]|nr:glucose 1-dehydrogenase [Solirubrobacterales bacterium]
MKRFAGRTAIITGYSRGIGAATARRLADQGARLVLVGRRAADLGLPGEAEVVEGDVAAPGTAAAAVAAADRRFGRLDVLVNNAGMDLAGDLLATSESDARRVFDTNFFGALFMLQAAAREMRPGGSIVNVTSRLASIGVQTMSVYGASKGALLSLTRGAAIDLAERGIRVNAVAPGMTATSLFEEWVAGQRDPEATRRAIESQIPQGRLGSPADVAAAIAFLASEESGHITGTSLPVDGGYTAA